VRRKIILLLILIREGYQLDKKEIISLTGFCSEGYEGIACSNCVPGYAKFGSKK